MFSNRFFLAIAAFAVVVWLGVNVQAASVPVGSSSLIGTLDYSDTFTLQDTDPGEPRYGDIIIDWAEGPDGNPSFLVETAYGGNDPTAEWVKHWNYKYVWGAAAAPLYPGNQNNPGAASGLAESLVYPGQNDMTFLYGVRDEFVVQVDAIPAFYNLDINLFAALGAQIPGGEGNGLSVFFMGDGMIMLRGDVTGAWDTGFTTGITPGDTTWHNYAVHVDIPGQAMSIYVDEALRGTLDLTAFPAVVGEEVLFSTPGLNPPSNIAVGVGGFDDPKPYWFDNFQVGAPVPEPSSLVMLLGGLIGLLACGCRKRK